MGDLYLIIVLFAIPGAAINAQTKVANYSYGKPGTENYEHFDFWTKDGKQTIINYAYGKDRKEVKLQYSGSDKVNGKDCFKVRFANNYILYIVPDEQHLQITDSSGKYSRSFSWEYEGPVNGVGTYCDVCAEDANEAITLVKSAFLK